jgi:hypothetical protein
VAIERTADAFGGAVDGDVKIALDILDDQGRSALEAHFDTATLVFAAARAIDIGKAHDDARDDVPAIIQGVARRADVLAQPVGQGKS